MLGTGGRLRRLAAMVGGEYARDDSMRCGLGGEGGEGSVVPPPPRIIDSSLDLCTIFLLTNNSQKLGKVTNL